MSREAQAQSQQQFTKKPKTPPIVEPPRDSDAKGDEATVDESSAESFPASDPPAWTTVTGAGRSEDEQDISADDER